MQDTELGSSRDVQLASLKEENEGLKKSLQKVKTDYGAIRKELAEKDS